MQPIKVMRRGGSGGGGGGGGSISITNQDATTEGNTMDPCTASYRLHPDGKVYQGFTLPNGSMSYTVIETWLASGVNVNFQARATVTIGAISSGITGTWLTLNAIAEWFVTANPGETKGATLLVEIRDAASPFAIRDSATITINALNAL